MDKRELSQIIGQSFHKGFRYLDNTDGVPMQIWDGINVLDDGLYGSVVEGVTDNVIEYLKQKGDL